jgi:hypothetical protein
MALSDRLWRLMCVQIRTHLVGFENLNPRSSDAEHGEPDAGDQEAQVSAEHGDAVARYYANLELPYGAPREAVRAARQRLLRRYHPDRFATDPGRAKLAHQLTAELNHAHDELLVYLERNPHG